MCPKRQTTLDGVICNGADVGGTSLTDVDRPRNVSVMRLVHPEREWRELQELPDSLRGRSGEQRCNRCHGLGCYVREALPEMHSVQRRAGHCYYPSRVCASHM